MSGIETSRWRARDAARWLRILRARGTHAPAISLLPDATRDLLSAAADPQRLTTVCRRAIDLIDRQILAERIAAISSAKAPTGADIEQDARRSAERQAAFCMLRRQFAEIVDAIDSDPPG